jgi:hypothetical protein
MVARWIEPIWYALVALYVLLGTLWMIIDAWVEGRRQRRAREAWESYYRRNGRPSTR